MSFLPTPQLAYEFPSAFNDSSSVTSTTKFHFVKALDGVGVTCFHGHILGIFPPHPIEEQI
jgi:hypothetical protein